MGGCGEDCGFDDFVVGGFLGVDEGVAGREGAGYGVLDGGWVAVLDQLGEFGGALVWGRGDEGDEFGDLVGSFFRFCFLGIIWLLGGGSFEN